MTPIPFRTNPAFTTLGDAFELTVAHLRAHIPLWASAALIYTLIIGALTHTVTQRFLDWMTPYLRDPYATRATADEILQQLAQNMPVFVALGVLSLIGNVALYWLAMAIAVGGLPGRRMTPDTAITAGLKTIALALLGIVILVPIVGVLMLLLLGATAADSPGLVLLLLLVIVPVAMVAAVYAAIRLQFATFAIFDGVGIIESLRVSWRISHGAVLRVLGWLVALYGVSIAVSIAGSIVAAPFSTTVPLVGTLLALALTTAFLFVQPVVVAILYESQRMRYLFSTPGMAGLAGGPVLPRSPTTSADPLQPPPPPAW